MLHWKTKLVTVAVLAALAASFGGLLDCLYGGYW
jgi:hypothetical protein